MHSIIEMFVCQPSHDKRAKGLRFQQHRAEDNHFNLSTAGERSVAWVRIISRIHYVSSKIRSSVLNLLYSCISRWSVYRAERQSQCAAGQSHLCCVRQTPQRGNNRGPLAISSRDSPRAGLPGGTPRKKRWLRPGCRPYSPENQISL